VILKDFSIVFVKYISLYKSDNPKRHDIFVCFIFCCQELTHHVGLEVQKCSDGLEFRLLKSKAIAVVMFSFP